MKASGVLVRWDDKKGFGYIQPIEGARVFAHVSAFKGRIRPYEGASVFFTTNQDIDGRVKANAVHLANHLSGQKMHLLGGERVKWSFFLALGVLPFWGCLSLWLHQNVYWPTGVYLFFSCVALMFYRFDKRQAQEGGDRVSEATLHWLEALGGWPGALLAQQRYRHKTRKISYQVFFWLLVAIHQLYWFDYIWMQGQLLISLKKIGGYWLWVVVDKGLALLS